MSALKSAWRRRFPSQARKKALEALGWCDDVFEEELFWPEIKSQIEFSLMRMDNEQLTTVTADDLTAANSTLLTIFRASLHRVSDGREHIYRGVLSIEGQSFRRIAELALDHLLENEFFDYDTFCEEKEAMAQAISEVG